MARRGSVEVSPSLVVMMSSPVLAMGTNELWRSVERKILPVSCGRRDWTAHVGQGNVSHDMFNFMFMYDI